MNHVKYLFIILGLIVCLTNCTTGNPTDSQEYRVSFNKTKTAIMDGFARGDVEAVMALHHPEVVKYFGGKNIVVGREGLRKQLSDMFNNGKAEFIENDIESTVFNGDAVVETSIFGMRLIPKNGDSSRIFRGRSMVVYVRYKESPTGWASIREMVQEIPPR
jgi:ketosteroid isomerase-like protein